MLWISQICPNASIGWDDSPRFPHKGKADIVQYNRSPEALASFLQKAKDHCDLHSEQPKLITLFSWNEWIEGRYLLPGIKTRLNDCFLVLNNYSSGNLSRFKNDPIIKIKL